jgi:hypothetical protein
MTEELRRLSVVNLYDEFLNGYRKAAEVELNRKVIQLFSLT